MPSVFLRPTQDIEVGNWTSTESPDGLYAALDESSPADASYAISGDLNDGADSFVVKIGPGTLAALPATLRPRYYKQVDSSETVNIRFTVYEDYGGGGETQIATVLYSDIGDTPVTGELLISSGVTDFTNLFLKVDASVPAGGAPSLDFSQAGNSQYLPLIF